MKKTSKLLKRRVLTARTNSYGNIAASDAKDKDGKILHVSEAQLRADNLPCDRLGPTCTARGIDFRLCFTGTKRSGAWSHPEYDGIYIDARDHERLVQALRDRKSKSLKSEVSRQKQDQRMSEKWKRDLLALYPNMPVQDAECIANHATVRGSGRVGRCTTVADPYKAATIAHIRHNYTQYDDLLYDGEDRETARHRVRFTIAEIYREWEGTIDTSQINDTEQLSRESVAEEAHVQSAKITDDSTLSNTVTADSTDTLATLAKSESDGICDISRQDSVQQE